MNLGISYFKNDTIIDQLYGNYKKTVPHAQVFWVFFSIPVFYFSFTKPRLSYCSFQVIDHVFVMST